MLAVSMPGLVKTTPLLLAGLIGVVIGAGTAGRDVWPINRRQSRRHNTAAIAGAGLLLAFLMGKAPELASAVGWIALGMGAVFFGVALASLGDLVRWQISGRRWPHDHACRGHPAREPGHETGSA